MLAVVFLFLRSIVVAPACRVTIPPTPVSQKTDMLTCNGVNAVVVPFYTACQECYFCVRGQASRCSKGELFGNSAPANTIDGGQAEYVRVPLADTTLVKTPKGTYIYAFDPAAPVGVRGAQTVSLPADHTVHTQQQLTRARKKQTSPRKCWS